MQQHLALTLAAGLVPCESRLLDKTAMYWNYYLAINGRFGFATWGAGWECICPTAYYHIPSIRRDFHFGSGAIISNAIKAHANRLDMTNAANGNAAQTCMQHEAT